MLAPLATIAWRTALCAAAAWALWRAGFGIGVVFIAGVFGIVIAKPLIDLAIGVRHAGRSLQWREAEGRYYAYRGRRIHVVDDVDGRRWVRLADLRAAIGFTASEATLRVVYPHGVANFGRPPTAHLDEDALLTHLDKERSIEAVRFRRWAEREIVFPARRDRERRGLKAAPRLESPSGD